MQPDTRPASAVGKAKQVVKREWEPSWRWVFNAHETRQWRGSRPELTPVARRALGDLERDGVVQLPVEQLCGDIYERLRERVDGLAQEHARQDAMAVKPFMVELLGPTPALRAGEPLLELLRHPQLRGVVEAYYRMRVRVRELNVWLNRPVAGDATMSQRWHRDLPEDNRIVKVFLYLRPVSPEGGALQYVTGSHRGPARRKARTGTWDGVNYRLDDELVNRAFAGHPIHTASGPAGTLVIADTRGVHRGGLVRDGERLLVYGRYASQSAVGLAPLAAATDADRAGLADVVL